MTKTQTPHRITLERAATITERLTFTTPLDPDAPLDHAEDLVMSGEYPDEVWTPDPESVRVTSANILTVEPDTTEPGGASPDAPERREHLIILTRPWEAGTAAAVRWTSSRVRGAETLLPALRDAVQAWVGAGGQPGEEDLNIGDLAGCLGDAALTAALAAQDVHDLTIDTTNMDASPDWEFDTNLLN